MKFAALALIAGSACLAQQPFVENYTSRYNAVKRNLLETAAAMPEDQYQFKLTPAQRTFADWIGHTIMLNRNMCSAAKGVPTAPMDHSKHGAKQSKADLQKELQDSFDFCDSVLKEMTDQKAMTAVEIGGKKSVPVGSLLTLLANLNSHYGNLVGYMRTKGIVPPSTARTVKK